MIVYITKYALTQGIYEADVEPSGNDNNRVRFGNQWGVPMWFTLGRDAFESRDDAEEQAKLMATRKLRSLQRQTSDMLRLASVPKWRPVAKEKP